MRFVAIFLLLSFTACGATFYVSTSGTDEASGTIEDPLSITKAIGATSPASSGDTVYLRGGIYSNTFACVVSGTSNSPVVFRNYNGERAIIDSHSQFAISGSGTWFWGLEFTDTYTNRYTSRTSGIGFNTGPTGSNNKLINCILHDLGNAIFVSSQSTNAEVTGCVIYNTGYSNTTWSGHGLYVQNHSYTNQMVWKENIIFNGYSIGINVRASSDNVNHLFSGNVVFDTAKNVYTEAYPADQLIFDSNMFYYSTAEEGGHFYGFEATNGTIVLSNNVFAKNFCNFVNWTNIVYNNNIQHRKFYAKEMGTNSVSADYNQYYNILDSIPVNFNDVSFTLAQWQSQFGNDSNGTATASSPSGVWTYVRSNPYEAGLANITIYNWATNDTASVDVSSVLNVGQRYEVLNAADYLSDPVTSGIYAGGNITLPMTNLTVATPVGLSARASTAPEFAVFVLKQLNDGRINIGTIRAQNLILR